VHGFRGTLQLQSFMQQVALNKKVATANSSHHFFISTIYIL
jgi:hypothetical protein